MRGDSVSGVTITLATSIGDLTSIAFTCWEMTFDLFEALGDF